MVTVQITLVLLKFLVEEISENISSLTHTHAHILIVHLKTMFAKVHIIIDNTFYIYIIIYYYYIIIIIFM